MLCKCPDWLCKAIPTCDMCFIVLKLKKTHTPHTQYQTVQIRSNPHGPIWWCYYYYYYYYSSVHVHVSSITTSSTNPCTAPNRVHPYPHVHLCNGKVNMMASALKNNICYQNLGRGVIYCMIHHHHHVLVSQPGQTTKNTK